MMRINLLVGILTVCCMQLSAGVFGQRVTLNVRKASVAEVVQQIEKQTGYTFFYDNLDMGRLGGITADLTGVPLEQALTKLFTERSFNFEIQDKVIVLRPSPKATSPAIKAALPQQQGVMTGTVRDSLHTPLQGVSVQVTGTNRGTITASDGSYTLQVNNGDRISFRLVGYLPFEITAQDQQVQNVVLQVESQDLEEVVVVAYGQQKKISITGAIATVSSEDFKTTSMPNFANALAGKLPGLTVMQNSGQPGFDDATFYLRGAATMNTKNPLILVDGVERTDIRTLDPAEIESVSVLKDASSTAVFGVRGANGVILITTLRGTTDKTELNASVTQSLTAFAFEPTRSSSVEYALLRNQAHINDALQPLYDDNYLAKLKNPLLGLDPNAPYFEEEAAYRRYIYPNHDYYRELISKYTPQTRANLNLRGGTGKMRYFINTSFLDQGGNLNVEPEEKLGYDPSLWMKRYSFRANLDYDFTKRLQLFMNVGSYIEQVNSPNPWLWNGNLDGMLYDIFNSAFRMMPLAPGPLTIEGFGTPGGYAIKYPNLDYSPFLTMNYMGFRRDVRSVINSTVGANWDLDFLTKGLSSRVMLSFDSHGTTRTHAENRAEVYNYEIFPDRDEIRFGNSSSDQKDLSLNKSSGSDYRINIQASLNYQRSFGKHDVGGLLLFQRDAWEVSGGSNVALIQYNILGLASRVTYAYDDRYFAELNLGYNGSEQFSPQNRFGFFPAYSAAWLASNERFLKGNNILTMLKFRGSFGSVGNDNSASQRFLYNSELTFNPSGGLWSSLGKGGRVIEGRLGNPNITWELAKKANLGFDLELMRAFTLTFDWFTERRSQILYSRRMIPEFQGVPLNNIPMVNIGRVNNGGYEVELKYNRISQGDTDIQIAGNFGYNKNKVIYADEPMLGDDYAYRYRMTGFPLNQQWGHVINYSNGNGYFNSKEEIDNYVNDQGLPVVYDGNPVLREGDFIYTDLNQDGIINERDVAPIKKSNIPQFTYGLTASIRYKQLDLNVFLQGLAGFSAYFSNFDYLFGGSYYEFTKNAWTPEAYQQGQEITYPALSTRTNTNYRENSFFIMDRSFLRLRNVELGFNLPKSSLEKLKIKGVRFFLSGQNLFTWSRMPTKDIDPEVMDVNRYPTTSMYNAGLSVQF